MPRITRGTSTSASTSGASSAVEVSSTARLRLKVETSSGEWWFVNQDAKAEWQEEDSALYQVKKGVWVLHSYPPGKHHVLRRERMPDGSMCMDIVLAGTSKQIEPREAAEWLLRHSYRLPAELRRFEKEVLTARERIPDASPGDDYSTNRETEAAKPIACSKNVMLFGRGEQPVVKSKKKALLTKARYDVVLSLIRAGDNGLSKDQLDEQSHHGDARRVLKRMADKDRDWKGVIQFPGKGGMGKHYRIL